MASISKPGLCTVFVGILLLCVSGCSDKEAGYFSLSNRQGLRLGKRSIEQWTPGNKTDNAKREEEVIARSYMERLRLGIGSPFRLIEMASLDPRLSDSTQAKLAWVLLFNTKKGISYQIQPEALSLTTLGSSLTLNRGQEHRDLIQRELSNGDVADKEKILRYAYTLALAERSITETGYPILTRAISLMADRQKSIEDASSLLDSADIGKSNALELLKVWRKERKLRVERAVPVLTAITRDELSEAEKIMASIRAISLSNVTLLESDDNKQTHSYLTLQDAKWLKRIQDTFNYPAQTPMVVGMKNYAPYFRVKGEFSQREGNHRKNFVQARNEEEFIVGHTMVLSDGNPGFNQQVLPLTHLWIATNMRTYSQEKIWFSGFPHPSVTQLKSMYGLKKVTFSPMVPERWKGYYLLNLSESLKDIQTVYPGISFKGLNIRFARHDSRSWVLAVHDPKNRTIYLPPETGAGVIAHELAHDLDWQKLRKSKQKGYASDKAFANRSDRMSEAILGLMVVTSQGSKDSIHNYRRPAEVFARGFDWITASLLATQGIRNGTLTSFQDELLTGYTNLSGGDVTREAGMAMLKLLKDISPSSITTANKFYKDGSQAGISSKEVSAIFAISSTGRNLAGYEYPAHISAVTDIAEQDLHHIVKKHNELIEKQGERCLPLIDAFTIHEHNVFLQKLSLARIRGIVLENAYRAGGKQALTNAQRELYNIGFILNDAPIDGYIISLIAQSKRKEAENVFKIPCYQPPLTPIFP